MENGLRCRGEFWTAPPAENKNMHPFWEMLDIMPSMGQNMSHPWNFRKHNEEVSISRLQTTVVRGEEQMKRPQTKTEDEQYTEGKPTCTGLSKLPCPIIAKQHSVFWQNKVLQDDTLFHDSIPPSFSAGQNYLHIDIEVTPPKQWKKVKMSLCTPWQHRGEAQLQLHWSVTSAEKRAEWSASYNSCFNAGEGSTISTEKETRWAPGLVRCSGWNICNFRLLTCFQSDIYQMLYWHNWFSCWWAWGWLKHAEKWSKCTRQRTVCQVGYLQTTVVLLSVFLVFCITWQWPRPKLVVTNFLYL